MPQRVMVNDLQDRIQLSAATRQLLARAVAGALNLGPHPAATVGVTLVDDDAMARLNRRYRGLDGPTDVLSFAQDDRDWPGRADDCGLGDVVISLETVERDAGADRRQRLLWLAVHGTLHLMGYRHDCDQQARLMDSLGRAALRELEP